MTMTESIGGTIRHMSGATRAQAVMAVMAVVLLPLALFGVVEIKTAAIDARMVESKHIVELAINATGGYYNAFMSGKITDREAKDAAITIVDRMAYDKTNYVFGYDYKSQPGKFILVFNRARPDLVGVDRTNATAVDGVKYVQAGYNVASHGGGYYQYLWDAGGTMPTPRLKVSYAESFEPWGWFIGTGTYIDDIISQFWDNISFVISLFAALLALGSAFTDWVYSPKRSQ